MSHRNSDHEREIWEVIDHFSKFDAKCMVTDDFIWETNWGADRPVPIIHLVHHGYMFAVPLSPNGYNKFISEAMAESESRRISASIVFKVASDYLSFAVPSFNLEPECSMCLDGQPYYIIETALSGKEALDAIRSSVRGAVELAVHDPYDPDAGDKWAMNHVRLDGSFTTVSGGRWMTLRDHVTSPQGVLHLYPIIGRPTNFLRLLSDTRVMTAAAQEYCALFASLKDCPMSKTLAINRAGGLSYIRSINGYRKACRIMLSMEALCTKCKIKIREMHPCPIQTLSNYESLDKSDESLGVLANLKDWVRWGTQNAYNQCHAILRNNDGTAPITHTTMCSILHELARNERSFSDSCSVYCAVCRALLERAGSQENSLEAWSDVFWPGLQIVYETEKPTKRMDSPQGLVMCVRCFYNRHDRCDACHKWTQTDSLYLKQLKYGKKDSIECKLCPPCSRVHTIHHPKSGILYGIEAELVANNHGDYYNSEEFFNAIREHMRRKFRTSMIWAHDGSLDGPTPIELITRPMPIDELRDFTSELSAALNEVVATVNSTCGLHLHIGGDINWYDAALLFEYCWRNENNVFSCFPSRRGNSYCRTMREAYPTNNMEMGRLKKLDKQTFLSTIVTNPNPQEKTLVSAYTMYDKYRPTGSFIGNRTMAAAARYSWANFYSFLYRRTVEIRVHPGTYDGSRMYKWASVWDTVMKHIRKDGRKWVHDSRFMDAWQEAYR